MDGGGWTVSASILSLIIPCFSIDVNAQLLGKVGIWTELIDGSM